MTINETRRPDLRVMESPEIRCPRPISIQEILLLPPPSWLIRDWLPANGLSLVYGLPTTGKTFAVLDMAAAIATGGNWNGQKVARGTVLYIAAEGVAGLGKRLRAMASRNPEIFSAPIFTIPAALDIVDQANEVVVRARDLAETNGNVVLVILDTLSRTLGDGREENSNRDMRDYVRAADLIRSSLCCAVLIVHHGGKDGSKGPRGHSSLTGDIDASFEVTASDTGHRITCQKQKDADKPEPLGFRLEAVPIGRGTDGEMETSCIVVFTGSSSSDAKQYPQGGRQRLIFDLVAAMATEPDAAKCPHDSNRPAVSVNALLNRWQSDTVTKSSPSNFRCSLKAMVERGVMESDQMLVWFP